MLFFLIRTLPFIIPAVYFLQLKGLFYFVDWWPLIISVGLLLNVLNFSLLKIKKREQKLLNFFLYTTIFSLLGLVFSLILENFWSINIFCLAWSLVYLILLETVFHNLYQTDKASLLNIKEVVGSVNYIIVFFATSIIVYFNVFLSLAWYWAILIFAVILLVCLRQAYSYQNQLNARQQSVYVWTILVILSQLLTALIFFPSSFYVISSIMTVIYYLIMTLSAAALAKNLTAKIIFKTVLSSCTVLALILITAAWF